MDLNVLAAQHRRTKADLTVAVVSLDKGLACRHHTLVVDDEGWVQKVLPPAADDPGALAVMGVLLFSTDVLSWRLSEDAQRLSSSHHLVRDVLPWMIEAGDRVMAFHYTGHWDAVQTVHDYWQAHMRLAHRDPGLNLQDTAWPIRTRPEVRPPTRVEERARVLHSLLSEGCIIDGTVEYSVLSPGVYVGPGAVVRNSIVMQDTIIEECAQVENAILDRSVLVGAYAQVGEVRRRSPRLEESMPEPLTVVTRDVHMPAHGVIKANRWFYDQLARAHTSVAAS
jgi:glucose-1-phosphate adenylyltransferase